MDGASCLDTYFIVQVEFIARDSTDSPVLARRLEEGDLDVVGRDAGCFDDVLVKRADEGFPRLDGAAFKEADFENEIAIGAVGRIKEVVLTEANEAMKALFRRVGKGFHHGAMDGVGKLLADGLELSFQSEDFDLGHGSPFTNACRERESERIAVSGEAVSVANGAGLLACELLLDEALDEGLERRSVFGQEKVVGFAGPVQFEAGGEGGDPNLADGRVGSDDEFGPGVFKEDVEDAVLLFDIESAVLFGNEEGLFEGFESAVRVIAKLSFIEHTGPVYRLIPVNL